MRFCRQKTFRWNFFQGSVLQTSLGFFAGVISSDLCQYLYHPIYRTHVSLSQLLGWAFASGELVRTSSYTRCGIWLVAYSVFAENYSGVSPFRMSIFRDRRPVLYAGFLSCGYHVQVDDVA